MIRALTLFALLAVPDISVAQTTTQDDVLQATLLPGWQMPGGNRMAGLRLDLAPGWKTYWRSPGDAGIPPSFDWAGSRNVRSVRILWPAPTVFHVNGMQSIGYHDQLVLPIEVKPIDPNQPMVLAAEVELGICDQICMPASLSLATDLTAPGAPDPQIEAALQARPATAKQAGVASVSCTVDPIKDGLRVTARVDMPLLGADETVAFETGDPSVWVAESAVIRKGRSLTATTELVGSSGTPFGLDRNGLTLTVIAGDRAVEIRGCPSP